MITHERFRPKKRGDCQGGQRPCVWTSCRYHLAGEVRGRLTETCALDVADRGGLTLEEVGRVLGITRERVRQIELIALCRLRWAIRENRHDVRTVAEVLRQAAGVDG